MEKQRMVMFLVLMALGAGLLAYGLHSQAAVGSSGEQGQVLSRPSRLARGLEPVSRRWSRGARSSETSPAEVKKTSAGKQRPKGPRACPT